DLDLALLDEVQQEIERPLEKIELDAAGCAHVGPSPMALRTSPIVASAISRARRLPASSTARASSAVSFARRSRIAPSSASTCLIITFLHSRQPIDAVLQPWVAQASSSGVQ